MTLTSAIVGIVSLNLMGLILSILLIVFGVPSLLFLLKTYKQSLELSSNLDNNHFNSLVSYCHIIFGLIITIYPITILISSFIKNEVIMLIQYLPILFSLIMGILTLYDFYKTHWTYQKSNLRQLIKRFGLDQESNIHSGKD